MNQNTKPEPVRMLGAITTGLAVFFGGLTLVAGLNDKPIVATVAGLGMLVTAAVNAGKDEYVRKTVVPVGDTAAYVNREGNLVTGPAAAAELGAPATVLASTEVVTDSATATSISTGFSAAPDAGGPDVTLRVTGVDMSANDIAREITHSLDSRNYGRGR